MMSPYKLQENNDIEVMSIIAGMLVLYCGIIFEEGQTYDYPKFDSVAMFILIIYNAMFLTHWIYFFLDSFNFKNETLRNLVKMYGFILWKRKNSNKAEVESEYEETRHLSKENSKIKGYEDQKVKLSTNNLK